MLFQLTLAAALLAGDALPGQSVQQTISQEKRGYEALSKMMDNVEAIQAKTKAELAAMQKTDFFKLPAKASSLLETTFDADKEEKELAAIGRKFQAQLAAIHGKPESSFLQTDGKAEDPADAEMDADMAKVQKEMQDFGHLKDQAAQRVTEVKAWAEKMHKEFQDDLKKDKASAQAPRLAAADAADTTNDKTHVGVPAKASSFAQVSADGKVVPVKTIPDISQFDPNKKYDIAGMKAKVQEDQDAVNDAKQRFEDSMDSWKNDKLQKMAIDEDDTSDDSLASSFIETGTGSLEASVAKNEKGISRLSKFVQTSPLFKAVERYAGYPTSSLLENGHTSEQIADIRGLVHSLKRAPQVEDMDTDLAAAQTRLTKVQAQVDAELSATQKKLDAQAKSWKEKEASSLLEEGAPRKFTPSKDLTAEKEDLLKTKALVAELHKKALRARAKMQEDFKHMSFTFHHAKGWGKIQSMMQKGDSMMQKGDNDVDDEKRANEAAMQDEESGEADSQDAPAPQDAQEGDDESSDDASFVQTKEKDLRTH